MKLFNHERILFAPFDGEGGGSEGGGGTTFEQIVEEHSEGEGDDFEGEVLDDEEEGGEGDGTEDGDDEILEEEGEETDEEEETSELDKILKTVKEKSGTKEDKQTLAVLNKTLGKDLQVKSIDELKDLVEDGKKSRELQANLVEQKQQFAAEAKLVVKKLADRAKEFEKEKASVKAIKKEHWAADAAYRMLEQYDPEAFESFTKVLKHVLPHYKEESEQKSGVLTKEDIRQAMKEEKEQQEMMQAKNEWVKGWGSLSSKVKELKRVGINVSEKLVQKEWLKDDNISVEKALLKAYAQELNSLNKRRLQKSEKRNIASMRDANLVGRNLGTKSKSTGRKMIDYDTFLSKF